MQEWQHPIAVSVIFPYKLRVTFEDGSVKIVDCANELHGPVFEPLHDPTYFARAFFHDELDTVAWPNGADLAPEFLWAKGVEVSPAVPRPAVTLPSAESFIDDVPGLREYWDGYKASGEFDADLLYVQMGWVGMYVAQRLIENRDLDLVAFAERLERVCAEGDAEVRDLIATGLLESIQNVWLANEGTLAHFPLRFGPSTTQLWDGVAALWEGKLSSPEFNRLIQDG